MRKLMVIMIRFLLLCTVLLVLPAVIAAQRRCSFLAYFKNRGYFQTKGGGQLC
jgi:hypothetical protein